MERMVDGTSVFSAVFEVVDAFSDVAFAWNLSHEMRLAVFCCLDWRG